MQISQWAAAMLGMPSDWWTAVQFDSAVIHFGSWVESKLSEYDYQAKRYHYTLDELLDDAPPLPGWGAVKHMLGSGRRIED